MRKHSGLTGRILKHMHESGEGAVFVTPDFLQMGSRAAVDQALSRLAQKGVIRRVGRGIYDIPRVNERMGLTLSASPDDVAAAVASAAASRVQVAGAQAANVLGLTTQVPARVVYLTDGAARVIRIGEQTIEFRHASPRSMAPAGKLSGTIIQALRHLGRSNVTPEVIRWLQTTLSKPEKALLQADRRYAPGWMQPLLEAIVAEEGK